MPNSSIIHPPYKTGQEPFSQKSAAHSLPNHCICRKNCSAVCFALHLLFECGILCLLWKNAGAVCRLSDEEKDILTDAAKIFVIKGEPVQLVRGEKSNVKITYPYDLTVAESLLKGE